MRLAVAGQALAGGVRGHPHGQTVDRSNERSMALSTVRVRPICLPSQTDLNHAAFNPFRCLLFTCGEASRSINRISNFGVGCTACRI